MKLISLHACAIRFVIKNESNISDQERYFLFPHHINIDPDNIIVKLSQFRCEWHCRQTNDHEISTTRFAQTVIIQLMTSFMISDCEQAISAQRLCTDWKRECKGRTVVAYMSINFKL